LTEPIYAQAGGSAQVDGSLQEANRQLIDRTLASCRGNVSRAARKIGVSRGPIYRPLRQTGMPAVP
jgi:transcriptional regulator of acetoin/glycerol metabolism